MIFRPTTLARGWRSVALAVSTDDARPALTGVHAEVYPHGVRLIATDSYVLLTAWVPDLEAEDQFLPEPDLDEAPMTVATVLDPHRRGQGLLAHALKLACAEPPEVTEVHVSFGVVFVDEAAPSLEGMEPRWCVIEVSERERVKLQLYDGEYPTWRGLYAGVQAEETKRVALNLEILGRLAKLPKLAGARDLGWEFAGPERPARVELIDSFPVVEGLVMPCRWDIERNAPAVEAKPDDETPNQEADA